MAAEPTMHVEDIRLKGADNGYILCFNEITTTPADKGQTYANKNYEYREEVYQDNQLNKAMKRLKELTGMMRGKGGSVDDTEEEGE